MFSGIIEANEKVLSYTPQNQTALLEIKKPKNFNDLKAGDSISVNGVCLTIEQFDEEKILFCVGPETLKVTGWSEDLVGVALNLERSLKYGDRVHGHFVQGHVDAVGKVDVSEPDGDAWRLVVKVPISLINYVWNKASLSINGVSLTVSEVVKISSGNDTKNDTEDGRYGALARVMLIPETLRRTNLSDLKKGDFVNLEADMMAKSVASMSEKVFQQRSLQS